jgi:hypothetical protein
MLCIIAMETVCSLQAKMLLLRFGSRTMERLDSLLCYSLNMRIATFFFFFFFFFSGFLNLSFMSCSDVERAISQCCGVVYVLAGWFLPPLHFNTCFFQQRAGTYDGHKGAVNSLAVNCE